MEIEIVEVFFSACIYLPCKKQFNSAAVFVDGTFNSHERLELVSVTST